MYAAGAGITGRRAPGCQPLERLAWAMRRTWHVSVSHRVSLLCDGRQRPHSILAFRTSSVRSTPCATHPATSCHRQGPEARYLSHPSALWVTMEQWFQMDVHGGRQDAGGDSCLIRTVSETGMLRPSPPGMGSCGVS